MNTEQFWISNFAKNSVIGDDAAFIDGFTYSADNFFENVHFRTCWMSMRQIAQKAMLVNISDAIAMNAVPLYALICIGIPKTLDRKSLSELSDGFKSIAKKYGIKIIGGDTVQNDKLDISITIIGKTDAPLYRSGLRIGDFIAYTGSLGSVKKQLESLENGEFVSPKAKFFVPKLKSSFTYAVAPFLSCGLDISDGLFSEMQRLSEANKVGFSFLKSIPNDVGCSGEEYEMLVGFSEDNYDRVMQIAAQTKTKLTVVARAVKGRFVSPCTAHHFV